MSRRKEIQVGITVLAAIAILILGLAWLKDYSMNRGTRVWAVEFPATGGLAEGDEVQVNGIRKGTVKKIDLAGDRVRVQLTISRDVTITHDSRVSVRNVGMMGEKIIAVDLKATGAPYRETDVIQGVYERDLGEMMGQLGETVDAIAGLSKNIHQVAEMMSGGGKLESTIDNFSRTSEELKLVVSENRAEVREILGNFAAASATTKRLTADREQDLSRTITRFSEASERMNTLTVRLDSLRGEIQAVSSKVNRGEGTLGKLVNDDKLYTDLRISVRQVQDLVRDVKANPKKYFKFSVF